VENTRSLARGLSPVHLERGGLRDALEGLAMHARGVYGIKAEFIDKFPPTIQLETEIANHLYRIAQEAVTNAVKHGRAESVQLHLTETHGKVRLTISDDGCGMPPALLGAARTASSPKASDGLGLRIMRYRARIARGDVRFENSAPQGTRVVCECPIDLSHAGLETETVRKRNSSQSSVTKAKQQLAQSTTARPDKARASAARTSKASVSARRSVHTADEAQRKLKIRAK
jgi:signal transduction histidine kinase